MEDDIDVEIFIQDGKSMWMNVYILNSSVSFEFKLTSFPLPFIQILEMKLYILFMQSKSRDKRRGGERKMKMREWKEISSDQITWAFLFYCSLNACEVESNRIVSNRIELNCVVILCMNWIPCIAIRFFFCLFIWNWNWL